MIPKIIYYICFGDTQNNITKKSINTWKKRAPEYEISASVTDELVYTDLVKYVSLDEPIEEWEKAFKKAIERIPQRRAYTEELKQSVYSAEDAGKNMTKIYEDLLASKLR
ncbi:hypothetical protein [Weissella confusa]|uniref:hypothetical protein n=1 Tax=Weissella confusa TaxID=1583 RepID=UPI00107F2EF1|nr:hypothetical protein [Weissella confusa]TGE57250.1 hypothetical protein C6P20_01340 [Weissella confusa]